MPGFFIPGPGLGPGGIAGAGVTVTLNQPCPGERVQAPAWPMAPMASLDSLAARLSAAACRGRSASESESLALAGPGQAPPVTEARLPSPSLSHWDSLAVAGSAAAGPGQNHQGEQPELRWSRSERLSS